MMKIYCAVISVVVAFTLAVVGTASAQPAAPRTPSNSSGVPTGNYLLKQYYSGSDFYPGALQSCTIGVSNGAMTYSATSQSETDELEFLTLLPALQLSGTLSNVIKEIKSAVLTGDCNVDGPPTTAYWYVPPAGINSAVLIKEICPPRPGLTSIIGDFVAHWIDTACPYQIGK